MPPMRRQYRLSIRAVPSMSRDRSWGFDGINEAMSVLVS